MREVWKCDLNIVIKFDESVLRNSPRIINSLRSYVTHLSVFRFPNTLKLAKNTQLHVVFQRTSQHLEIR